MNVLYSTSIVDLHVCLSSVAKSYHEILQHDMAILANHTREKTVISYFPAQKQAHWSA